MSARFKSPYFLECFCWHVALIPARGLDLLECQSLLIGGVVIFLGTLLPCPHSINDIFIHSIKIVSLYIQLPLLSNSNLFIDFSI